MQRERGERRKEERKEKGERWGEGTGGEDNSVNSKIVVECICLFQWGRDKGKSIWKEKEGRKAKNVKYSV